MSGMKGGGNEKEDDVPHKGWAYNTTLWFRIADDPHGNAFFECDT